MVTMMKKLVRGYYNMKLPQKTKFLSIGVVSVADILGRRTIEGYVANILLDFFSLQDGGVDLILIENEGDKAISRKANPETVQLLESILERINKSKTCVRIPYLIGVLPADYEASFELAHKFNALGVWMDTLVDKVSPKYTDKSIVINIDLKDVLKYKGNKMLYVEVQPRNFYKILDKKPLEESVKLAKQYADAVCIVGEENPPSLDLLRNVRNITGENYPIGVSGKLSSDNITDYFGLADFGVFFSHLREDSNYEKPIDLKRVKHLTSIIKGC